MIAKNKIPILLPVLTLMLFMSGLYLYRHGILTKYTLQIFRKMLLWKVY
jgi:hypothetical protein